MQATNILLDISKTAVIVIHTNNGCLSRYVYVCRCQYLMPQLSLCVHDVLAYLLILAALICVL